MTPGDQFLLAVLACILAVSAVSDLRHLRIPNAHVLMVLGVFLLGAPILLSLPEISSRLICAAVTFGIGFGLFSLRLFGGGDVKMMAAVMLYVPAGSLVLFLWLFSLALLASSLVAVGLKHTEIAGLRGWKSYRARGHVPVAVSIFLATFGLALAGAV